MIGPEDGADDAPPRGNVKASREDWISGAMDLLVAQGVDHVKVLEISARLGVSRSSFYWYFKNRQELLDALLETWAQSSTGALLASCDEEATTITGAVCNVFLCFFDIRRFDPHLDLAIRDWARRSAFVRKAVDDADAARIGALTQMFARYGYDAGDAEIRARVLYFAQVGYSALAMGETVESRLPRARAYLRILTGENARSEELEQLARRAFEQRDNNTEQRERRNRLLMREI